MAERRKSPEKDEERRQLRPYRRFVRVVFFAAVCVLSFLILRGLIRSIDRLPTAAGARPTGPVDVRALRACAEDLGKLEKKLRTAAGEVLTRDPGGAPQSWQTFIQPYEMERMSIVAHCRLDEPSDDPAVADLKQAASAIEDVARSYGLMYDRHQSEGHERSKDVAQALRRASEALKTRE